MKKDTLFRYGHWVIVSSFVLLPGCALLDSIFGTSEEKQEAQRRELTSAGIARHEEAELNEAIKDEAVEALTEGGTVATDGEELTGAALVTMNGKPIVTSESLESEEAKLLDANPQLKQMLAFMDPAQLRRNLAEGLMNQALVDQAIVDKGVNQTAEYKKEIKEGIKAVERMVNTKFFTQSFDVRTSDADVRKFYDANKDTMPQLVISRGGVKAMGLQFDTEPEAKAFAAQVTAQGNDIKKAAQAAGMTDKVRDFMTVNQQSMNVDQELKAKIMDMTKVPSVDVVKLKDNKVWVAVATGKEDAQYRPFDQVKAEIKDYLEKEERAKRFDEEITKLKTKYNVKMDETFFTAEPGEEMDLESALPEDLISQLEEDDVLGTVAYHDVDTPSSI
jgi:hypothetical protein